MKYIIWVDEAGRWPWLWPVCAVCLCFNPKNKPDNNFISKLWDSKKISKKKREKLYNELIEKSRWDNPQIFFGLWLVDNFIIDEINIKQANKEAMRRALLELSRKIPHPQPLYPKTSFSWTKLNSPLPCKEGKIFNVNIEVLIDWKDNYEFEELEKKPTYIVWWDWKIPEIWASSIIAKVFRDKILIQYASLYPDLQIENHKWYWTKKHIEFLSWKTKITWIHRLSYKPIKKILEEN